jgi:hypothetical protein
MREVVARPRESRKFATAMYVPYSRAPWCSKMVMEKAPAVASACEDSSHDISKDVMKREAIKIQHTTRARTRVRTLHSDCNLRKQLCDITHLVKSERLAGGSIIHGIYERVRLVMH